MKQEDQNAFAKVLVSIAELYSKKLSVELFEIYWQALNKYSLAEISQALNKHVLNPDHGQFMPKPNDIINYLESSAQTRAYEAWTKVQSAIKSVGHYNSVVFDDPLIHIVVTEMGGWVWLCLRKESEQSFYKQEFISHYQVLMKQAIKPYQSILPGVHFHLLTPENSTHELLIFFGDKAKAKATMLTGLQLMNQMNQMNNPLETIMDNTKH